MDLMCPRRFAHGQTLRRTLKHPHDRHCDWRYIDSCPSYQPWRYPGLNHVALRLSILLAGWFDTELKVLTTMRTPRTIAPLLIVEIHLCGIFGQIVYVAHVARRGIVRHSGGVVVVGEPFCQVFACSLGQHT